MEECAMMPLEPQKEPCVKMGDGSCPLVCWMELNPALMLPYSVFGDET